MPFALQETDGFADTNGTFLVGHVPDNAGGGSGAAAWQEQIGSGVTIQSNRATSPVTAGTYVNTLNTSSTDGRVTANVYGVANGVGVICRFDPGTAGYYGYIGDNTQSRLFYFDGLSFNVIQSGGPALVDGDTIAIVPNGTTISGYRNGSPTVSVVDTHIATGKPGLYFGAGGSAADNFIYETGTAPVVTATKLAIQTPLVGNQSGVNFTTQPAVAVQDVSSATVTTDSSTVTATLNTVSGSGTLGGTATAVASSGVATFTNLKVTGTGSFTITYTDGALTSVTTPTFYVGATQLAITSAPTTAFSKYASTIVVTAKDANGVAVGNYTGTVAVTLTKTSGAGSVATMTGGTSSAAAVAGVATLTPIATTSDNGLVATSYTYTAAATGLTSATTATITPTVSESVAVTIT